jgi:hypothetical protein
MVISPMRLVREGHVEEGSHDGMAFRVTLDFYFGATDYRAAYRNPGT